MKYYLRALRGLFLFLGAIAWAGSIFAAPEQASANHSADHGVNYAGILLPSCVIAAVIVIGWFLYRKKRATLAADAVTTQLPVESTSPVIQKTALAEEADFARYLSEVRKEEAPKTLTAGNDKLKEFFAWAPGEIGNLRKLVAKAGREASPVTQQQLLTEVSERLTQVKNRTEEPELRPAWQLATALEGLLKQLVRQVSNLNSSTQRTLGNGLSLLADLCAQGVRADLVSNPAIRILAVDDDAVCRLAVSSAIKKAFEQPDLADSGSVAVSLAEKQRYDLIILDVMMPEMDGFEVCAKIRESRLNQFTPVLFVTALKDFDSRTKLLATGGNEVLGKPFLAFEITAKALTLVLSARLRSRNLVAVGVDPTVSHSTPAVGWTAPETTPRTNDDLPMELPPRSVRPADAAQSGGAWAREDEVFQKISPQALDRMPACVERIKRLIAEMEAEQDPEVQRELALRIYLRLQGMAHKINVPELKPAFEICRSLEGLFNKFSENTKHITESAVHTALSALDLLNDLCEPGVRRDLAECPPVRMLVVDDEPLARRAVTGALQMTFARPATADTGEEAVELADKQSYDLIFMDVCMPGMDGFQTCEKIHELSSNRSTPVVFVTSHCGDEFRNKAAESGAIDYVVKPFIFMEINLKALTLALRGRLRKEKSAKVHGAAVLN